LNRLLLLRLNRLLLLRLSRLLLLRLSRCRLRLLRHLSRAIGRQYFRHDGLLWLCSSADRWGVPGGLS